MQKDEILLQNRLIELSRNSYHKGIVTFSDFLNINELNILHSIPKAEFYTNYQTFGGYDLAERQMVAFLPDALCYEFKYPISVIEIQPLQSKFAEQLTHRDFLGAIMNLGIERCKIGDIAVMDQRAYILVVTSLNAYISEELKRIKHTSVKCNIHDLITFEYTPEFKEIKGTVSSLRLDSLLALAFQSSRSKIVPLIEGGFVFVNGKRIVSNGYQIKQNDIISARGLGRFQFNQTLTTTKKGRIMVSINLYV